MIRQIAIFTVATTITSVTPAAADLKEAPQQLKPAAVGVGRLVQAVKALDIAGKQVDLSDFHDRKALVIAMTSTSCPLCQRYAPTLARLEKQFAGKGVGFIFVDPIKTNTLEEARDAVKTHGLQGPFVRDVDNAITAALGAKSTTEVFVLDPARTLVYRGAVDDQYGLGYSLDAPRHNYLADALDAVLIGKQPAIAATTAPGCELASTSNTPATTTVTYHNRISRIMQANCLECHRKGGIGPFSLETYDDVVAHRGMIRKVVERGAMPPWFAANQPQHNLWANERSLAAADKTDLLAWLAGTHPVGDVKDAPAPRHFNSEWLIGEPDVVLQIPRPMPVKATGTMPYQHAIIKTDFKEDKWVQAVEIRPTDRAVVHHVLVFAIGKDGAGRIDETSGFFAAYVPGNSAQQYPPGFAKRLPAGATLAFQLHYTPKGTATTDQTRIGFIFAKEPPKHIVRNVGIANRRISIPAGADNHPEHATQPVPVDVQVLAFMPHMHLRGKAFRYDLVSADGKKQLLLDVPRYDFNWQLEYRLAEPLSVPAGSRVEVTGWFDNSTKNPANPNAQRTVRWGPQTEDEMLLGYVEYYIPSETTDGSGGPANDIRTATAGGRLAGLVTTLFRRADRNGDGKVTAEELNRPQLFERLDLNNDGYIELSEAQKVLPEMLERKD